MTEEEWLNDIHIGDAEEVLEDMPSESVDSVVTSPPYWGLRDYGEEGQLGLEDTPEEYVERLVNIFNEVKRVLKPSGTLWLNLGDSYNDKSLAGIPWRVAFSLQRDGWFLRNDIIWMKPNPMPESVTDRCTTSHEHIFLFSKNKKYWFDQDAIREPLEKSSKKRLRYGYGGSKGQEKKKVSSINTKTIEKSKDKQLSKGRNKRDVWEITTKSFAPAHFAVFPPELPRTCVKAGCPPKVCGECGKPYERDVEHKRIRRDELPENDSRYRPNKYNGEYADINGKGDAGYSKNIHKGWEQVCGCSTDEVESGVVLDPFIGAGTTGLVAKQLNRNWIGVDIKEEYREMALERIEKGDEYMRRKEREKRKKEKMQKNHKFLDEFMSEVGGSS